MGHQGAAYHLDAAGRVRPRRAARRRGDDDARHLSLSPRVVLYHAAGCHLCERARRVIEGVRAEVPFELEEIDIGGDVRLEQRYREWLPVVEIEGERAFVYHVDPGALRRKLGAQTRA